MSQPQPSNPPVIPGKPTPLPPIIPLPPPVIPGKPDPQNQFDEYGCVSAAGFYWSPSQQMCCKIGECSTPQPWVCTADQLPKVGSMDWHGCKRPNQVYAPSSGKCCDSVCVPPHFNKK